PSRLPLLFDELPDVAIRKQVDDNRFSRPPIRRQLQYGRATESPMRKENVLFKSRTMVGYAAIHTIACQRGKPIGILSGYGERHQCWRRGHHIEAKLAGDTQCKVAGTQLRYPQSAARDDDRVRENAPYFSAPLIGHGKAAISTVIDSYHITVQPHFLPIVLHEFNKNVHHVFCFIAYRE